NKHESLPGGELLSATLAWIAEAFPGHEIEASAAKRRMLAVRSAWNELTQRFVRRGEWIRIRDAWPLGQVREGIRFGKNDKARRAGLVVYDSPPADSQTTPLMIVEYLTTKDADHIARWWCDEISVDVVVLLLKDNERRLYSRSGAQRGGSTSERWD